MTHQISLAIFQFRNDLVPGTSHPFLIGLAEDLVISFSKFLGISVISQFSTFQLDPHKEFQKIQELSADYLITGKT